MMDRTNTLPSIFQNQALGTQGYIFTTKISYQKIFNQTFVKERDLVARTTEEKQVLLDAIMEVWTALNNCIQRGMPLEKETWDPKIAQTTAQIIEFSKPYLRMLPEPDISLTKIESSLCYGHVELVYGLFNSTIAFEKMLMAIQQVQKVKVDDLNKFYKIYLEIVDRYSKYLDEYNKGLKRPREPVPTNSRAEAEAKSKEQKERLGNVFASIDEMIVEFNHICKDLSKVFGVFPMVEQLLQFKEIKILDAHFEDSLRDKLTEESRKLENSPAVQRIRDFIRSSELNKPHEPSGNSFWKVVIENSELSELNESSELSKPHEPSGKSFWSVV